MTLDRYLADNKISDAAFAAQVGISRQAIGRYRSGDRRPEWDVLAKIRDATGGAVTADDFMPERPAAEAAE